MARPILCLCGHFHGGTCHCGCTTYQPDTCPVCDGHGCHVLAQPDAVDELVDWELRESPAAQSEQRRRESAARWNWRSA